MSPIRLSAGLNLTASTGQRRFQILAYTGGELRIEGFPLPVVVDLAGLQAGSNLPIITDHQPSVENTLGQVDVVENTGRLLMLGGPITGTSEKVRQVLAQHDAGHRWGASIGAVVKDIEEIAAGRTVRVNGREFRGPIIVARRAEVRETSILPNPADDASQVNLAARAAQGGIMSFEKWCEQMGIDVGKLTEAAKDALMQAFTAEQQKANGEPAAGDAVPAAAGAVVNLRASAAAELRRQNEIRVLCGARLDIAATAIENGWSRAEAEVAVLKSQRVQSAPSNHIQSDTNGAPDDGMVLCASLALSGGCNADRLAKSEGMNQYIVDAAMNRRHRGATLHTLMERTIIAAGMTPPSERVNDAYIRCAFEADRMLRANYSTIAIGGILSNTANKLLLDGFQSVASTWQLFCAKTDLSNFHEHTRYRMTPRGTFEVIAKGGEIKHAWLSEESFTNKAKTYGKMLSVSREDLVNDDMDAISTVPRSLGLMGIKAIERAVYVALLGNTGDFFAAGNNNYLSGGGSALSETALTAAEKKFLNRLDPNGEPMLLVPELVLVPSSLSVTANQLTRDTQVVAIGVGNSAATKPSGNPHAGRFEPAVSPWLELSTVTGNSATGWYLLARPQGNSGLIDVGFLDGQQTPKVEQAEMDFNQLGIRMRAYFDFGVALADGRFGVFNVGE